MVMRKKCEELITLIFTLIDFGTRGCIQKFPDWVYNENKNSNKHSLRSSTKGYGGKTHYTDSQAINTTAPCGRALYHLQLSLQQGESRNFWIHRHTTFRQLFSYIC